MPSSSVGHIPIGMRPPCVLGLLGSRRGSFPERHRRDSAARPRLRGGQRLELRSFRASLHDCIAYRKPRGKDEPGGAAGRSPRLLLRDVTRRRACEGRNTASASRRPLHDHDGRGRGDGTPDRVVRDRRTRHRLGCRLRVVRPGCRGRRRRVPVFRAHQGERYRDNRRNTRGGA